MALENPQANAYINAFKENLSRFEQKENLSSEDCQFLVNGLNKTIALLQDERTGLLDATMKLKTLNALRGRLIEIGKGIYEKGGASKEYAAQITKVFSDLKTTLISIQVSGGVMAPPAKFTAPISKPSGLGQMPQKSEGAKAVETVESRQLLKQFKEYAESLGVLSLTEAQQRRVNQTEIITMALDSIYSEIKNRRTAGSKVSQFLDALSDTWFRDDGNDAVQKLIELSNEKELIIKATKLLLKNPEMTLEDALTKVGSNAKKFLAEYGLQEKRGVYGKVGTIMDPETLNFKEATTVEELEEQYLALVEFLRSRNDQEAVKVLVEDRLLKDYFSRERVKLAEKEKADIRKEALRTTVKILFDAYKVWNEKKIPKEMQIAWAQAIEQEQIERTENMFIMKRGDKMFEGVSGNEYKTLNVYKSSKGVGEWYELSDETWNTIIEEIAINGPLLIISGGIANLARTALSGAAKLLIASQRFANVAAKFGLAAQVTAEAGIKIVTTGKLGQNMMALGKVTGAVVEGAVFDIAHTTMTNPESLMHRDLPEWGKSIFWSSLILGTFHYSGDVARNANAALSRMLTKVPKPIMETFQKLVVSGSIETATMFGVSALQHLVETGDYKFEDFDELQQLMHSLLVVGALRISGTVVGGLKIIGRRTKTVETDVSAHEEGAKSEAAEKVTEPVVEKPSLMKELPPELAIRVEGAFKKAKLPIEWLEATFGELSLVDRIEATKRVVEKLDGEFAKGKRLNSRELLERLKTSTDVAEVAAIQILFRNRRLKVKFATKELEGLLRNERTELIATEYLARNLKNPAYQEQVARYLERRVGPLKAALGKLFKLVDRSAKRDLTPQEKLKLQAISDAIAADPSYKMVSSIGNFFGGRLSPAFRFLTVGPLAFATTGCGTAGKLTFGVVGKTVDIGWWAISTKVGFITMIGSRLAYITYKYGKAFPRKQIGESGNQLQGEVDKVRGAPTRPAEGVAPATLAVVASRPAIPATVVGPTRVKVERILDSMEYDLPDTNPLNIGGTLKKVGQGHYGIGGRFARIGGLSRVLPFIGTLSRGDGFVKKRLNLSSFEKYRAYFDKFWGKDHFIKDVSDLQKAYDNYAKRTKDLMDSLRSGTTSVLPTAVQTLVDSLAAKKKLLSNPIPVAGETTGLVEKLKTHQEDGGRKFIMDFNTANPRAKAGEADKAYEREERRLEKEIEKVTKEIEKLETRIGPILSLDVIIRDIEAAEKIITDKMTELEKALTRDPSAWLGAWYFVLNTLDVKTIRRILPGTWNLMKKMGIKGTITAALLIAVILVGISIRDTISNGFKSVGDFFGVVELTKEDILKKAENWTYYKKDLDKISTEEAMRTKSRTSIADILKDFDTFNRCVTSTKNTGSNLYKHFTSPKLGKNTFGDDDNVAFYEKLKESYEKGAPQKSPQLPLRTPTGSSKSGGIDRDKFNDAF